jgi:hypothetical protein
MKPLKKRNLPISAQRYKAKTPKSSLEARFDASLASNLANFTSTPTVDNLNSESAGEIAKETKIPVPKSNSIKEEMLKSASIYHIESEYLRMVRSKMGVASDNINQMEMAVLGQIEDHSIWEVELLKDLVHLIEPMYAADKLKEHDIGVLVDLEEGEPPFSLDLPFYNFNTKFYDNHIIIPSAGLFFSSFAPEKKPISSKKEHSYTKIHGSASRPVSAYSVKSTYSAQRTSPKASPSKQVEETEEPTTTCFVSLAEEQSQNVKSLKTPVDDDQYHRQQVPTFDDRPSSTSTVGRSHSSNATNRKFKVAYFPQVDTKLGGLGHDKDSEEYLKKVLYIE